MAANIESLEKLGELKERGYLSEEEFEKEKIKILAGGSDTIIEKSLSLFNPSVALWLSCISSPIFGSIINYLNSKSLNSPDQKRISLFWISVFGMYAISGLLNSNSDYYYFPTIFLGIVWFLTSGLYQVRFVNSKYEGNYKRKSYILPIVLSIVPIIYFNIFMFAVKQPSESNRKEESNTNENILDSTDTSIENSLQSNQIVNPKNELEVAFNKTFYIMDVLYEAAHIGYSTLKSAGCLNSVQNQLDFLNKNKSTIISTLRYVNNPETQKRLNNKAVLPRELGQKLIALELRNKQINSHLAALRVSMGCPIDSDSSMPLTLFYIETGLLGGLK